MNYEIARQLVAEALSYAQSQGFSAAASVVDSGGHLLAFGRSDGASFISPSITLRKAFTSASIGVPTKALASFAIADPAVGADLQKQTDLCTVAGGIPIRIDGIIVGGFGVAGGQGEQDHAVAEFALRQVFATAHARA